MMELVQAYDNIGWVVMPIRSNSKIPVIKSWSKITSNDETMDKFNDDSNLGVVMGAASGIICIDVDVKAADGVATLKGLEQQYGKLPETVMSETPSGGIHYYFKYHEGIRNRKKVGPGIDIQADGTQTLEYPSVIDGEYYEWVYDPFENEVSELPQTWLDFLCEKGDGIKLAEAPFEAPTEVQEGSRNNTIAAYVGSMLGKKLKKKTVLNKALKYNKESCDPPLDDSEVEQIVDSMIKTDITNKRNLVTKVLNDQNETENDQIELPWLSFDETGAATIHEMKFADWYVERNQIHCVNKRFFTRYGLKDDGWFENDIQKIIGGIITVKLATKVQDLLKVIKNQCYMSVGTPDPYKLQFDNVSFDVRNGKLEKCDEYFTLHQIPHNYDPNAKCPTWDNFIKELFYVEDIPVVQEYLGYCLLPNTYAQTAMFITGEGGEGKSRITIMMEHIIGENSVVVGDFKGLQDRFSLSSLDNQMLFIDDDLSLDALDDTSNFKKVVTAETALEVEAKGVPKYKTHLYSKILCMGNGAVQSKFDKSDGFYRRLLISRVKPIDSKRAIDTRLADKLKEETPGIINWLLEGLLRVVNNGFIIKPSKRMADQVQELRDNSDTVTLYMKDTQYVEYTFDTNDVVSVKELYDAYEAWCHENSYLCVHKNTFGKNIRKIYKTILCEKCSDGEIVNQLANKERVYFKGKQVRGLAGVKVTNYRKSFTIQS